MMSPRNAEIKHVGHIPP